VMQRKICSPEIAEAFPMTPGQERGQADLLPLRATQRITLPVQGRMTVGVMATLATRTAPDPAHDAGRDGVVEDYDGDSGEDENQGTKESAAENPLRGPVGHPPEETSEDINPKMLS
jgi:hypothetical protein